MSETPSSPSAPNVSTVTVVLKILLLLGCLYAFIVGITAMGSAFKLFGKGFAESMLNTTSSPFVGLFIGILATAIVQSSSTTTTLVVGMVAGGAITIEGAIPMVMGANIGTTVTCLMVSMGQMARRSEFKRAFAAATVHDFFNLITVAVLFPLELATGILAKLSGLMQSAFAGVGGMKLANPLKAAVKPAVHWLQELVHDQPIALLIISILLIIGMLIAIVKILRSLVLERVETFFNQHLFRNAGRAMAFGLLLTCAVQSSSITTSLAVPLAGAGILTLAQIFPYAMGANVGTTITAILAALATGNPAAVTVSFAHLLFNVSGILLIWPHPKIRMIPIRCAEWLSGHAEKRLWVPFVFALLLFFVIPILLITLFR